MLITDPDQIKLLNRGADYYNGAAISDRFGYTMFRKDVRRVGNIVAFVSPCKVVADFMVDQEDLLSNDFIYSDKMIHFLIEIPDLDLWGGVFFQRYFNTQIGFILSEYLPNGHNVRMKGDDILVNYIKDGNEYLQKASVSIAKQKNGAVLIHTGINIEAGPTAPSFAYSTGLDEEQATLFIEECIRACNDILHDTFIATCKIIA